MSKLASSLPYDDVINIDDNLKFFSTGVELLGHRPVGGTLCTLYGQEFPFFFLRSLLVDIHPAISGRVTENSVLW